MPRSFLLLVFFFFYREIVDRKRAPWDVLFAPEDSRLSVDIACLFFRSGCLQRVRLRVVGWRDTRGAESSFVPMLNRGGRRKKYINSHPASRFFHSPVAHPCLSLLPVTSFTSISSPYVVRYTNDSTLPVPLEPTTFSCRRSSTFKKDNRCEYASCFATWTRKSRN